MTRRLTIAGLSAAAVAAALLVGGVLNEPSGADAGPVYPAVVAERTLSGFAAGDTAALVERLRRLKDPSSRALLGLAYQQRWRETADPTYLTRSEAALRRAGSSDPLAVAALASLALSRHDFRAALPLARRAVSLAPHTARGYGVLGDALVELGRYEQAFAAFDRMVSLRPGLASYARVAYARELLGRPRAAIAAMELALDAAAGQPEPTAWTHVELGKLRFGLGELGPAARHFRAALAAFPGYVYAFEGLARVEAARGRIPRAIGLARRAVDRVPLPQFVATLGDLYRASGGEREARKQYAVIGVIERLLRSGGVRTDLETALFDVDHGIRLEDALVRARRAWRERPSIEADDVLAWALARTGRCGEALRYSKRALRLGTRDASRFFHRGMIERCLGRRGAAGEWFRRALELNPHFSLVWAPAAERYAR
jgi:tetratricopeptide (TPR) repeat protein